MRKPAIAEIRKHLDAYNPLGLGGAEIEAVSERNHLVYRASKGGRVYALRMINPESYRAGEWISMAEEYELLAVLGPTGLGPRVYGFDDQFSAPFLIQEFVQATCFNDLKPLSREHLLAAAQAIALLNAQEITSQRLPFLSKYLWRDYAGSGWVWYFRLFDAFRRLPRRDVLVWILRILPLAKKTMAKLYRLVRFLPQEFTFHFDGAHCGNTYWRDGKVIFLDWQKVSYRNDPTFTLVRLATSIGDKGEVPEPAWRTLINAYLEIRKVPNFADFAGLRLLERQTADLVWAVWDHARRRDPRPIEWGTSVVLRYEMVRQKLLM